MPIQCLGYKFLRMIKLYFFASALHSNMSHLFVGSLSYTHHKKEQPCEADSLNCCDEEKGRSSGVRRPHCDFNQLCEREGAEARHVQTLSQAERKGKQRQGGRHKATEDEVTNALLH